MRSSEKSGLLLSGGVDSSLLLNVVKRVASPAWPPPVTVTGAVKGFVQGETEIKTAAALAAAMNVPHAAIVVDPKDELLPEEWMKCTTSMTGGRLGLLLFYRFGLHLRDRIGEGYGVLSGQMADTVADNNYTSPSGGYTFRRAFCSPWFLSIMPVLRRFGPSTSGPVGRGFGNFLRSLHRPRLAGMWESVLDGMQNTQRFYDGRLFGYGEMPGRAPAYFPSIRALQFDLMADWYSSHFIAPAIADMTPDTFYQNMIELNMDMVMLHLDTRPAFQVFRLTGGAAKLPFGDARVVNYFCSLPYSARAFWRKPKMVISNQFERRKLVRVKGAAVPTSTNGSRAASPEQRILDGSLGAFLRELLSRQTIPDRVPGLFEVVDERFFNDQIQRFSTDSPGVDHVFIGKIAALEFWNRDISKRKSNTLGRAVLSPRQI